jgi:hypothetical protein
MDPQPNYTTPPPPPTAPVKKSNTLLYVLLGCGVILLIGGIVAVGSIWYGYHKAKGYVEKELGANSGTKVAQLWSDVPRMDGMDESQQIEMPVGLKIIASKMLDGMMRGVNNGKDAGHWDWAAFSVKGKTPADVQSFYTAERMTEHGWKKEGGCSNMPTGTGGDEASFCGFTKEEGKKGTGLIMIAAEDKENQAVSIFIIRQEGVSSS